MPQRTTCTGNLTWHSSKRCRTKKKSSDIMALLQKVLFRIMKNPSTVVHVKSSLQTLMVRRFRQRFTLKADSISILCTAAKVYYLYTSVGRLCAQYLSNGFYQSASFFVGLPLHSLYSEECRFRATLVKSVV